jgi:SAM-dependent methyltransferase
MTAVETAYQAVKAKIAPSLRFNQSLYEDALHENVPLNGVWLDAGCGWKVLPEWRMESEKSLVDKARMAIGADTDTAAIAKHRTIHNRVICNLSNLPFKPSSLDVISLNMVMEHVESPEPMLKDFALSLKPGGTVIIHTPHKWSYFALFAWLASDGWKRRVRPDGREAEDYYPVRYRCNSPYAMRKLGRQAGLKEVRTSLYASDAVCRVLSLSWLGRVMLRAELTLIRLSLTSTLRWLRVTMCAIYRKPF